MGGKVITGEKESTIHSFDNAYVTFNKTPAIRIFCSPVVHSSIPCVLLSTHPKYNNIYDQLTERCTYNFKCHHSDKHNCVVIDSISECNKKTISGRVKYILNISNELPKSDDFEIIVSDFKGRLVCSKEIKKLVTVGAKYIFTCVKDFGDCKYAIMSVEHQNTSHYISQPSKEVNCI